MSLPGEAELLPWGPKSILGLGRGGAMGTQTLPAVGIAGVGFTITWQEPSYHPGEGGQGFGWQLEAAARAAALEGTSLAPAQRRLHRNR